MLENNALNRAPGKKDAARATGDIFRIQKLDFEKHKYYTRLRQVLLFYSFFCTTGLSQQEKQPKDPSGTEIRCIGRTKNVIS